MAIYSTYEAVGVKENIADIISNIAPTDTPFQTSIKTERTRNINYQWQEDSLASAAANKKAEGFTAASVTASPTTMRSNTTQILSKTAEVSGSMDAQESYGRDRELAYQLAKVSKELKRDLEYHLVGLVQAKVTGDDDVDGAGTPREFANVPSMISSNTTVDAGTSAPLIEDDVLSLNQKLFEQGGEASIMMIKPSDALVVANFAYRSQVFGTNTAAVTERSREVTGNRIVNAIDFYKSPFGEQKFVLNRFQSTAHLFAFDPDSWRLMVYRPWTRETLAKVGDKTSVMVVGEYGLKHKNYALSGMIKDLA